MQVFIVSQGETPEGSRIQNVFSTIEKAREFAETLRAKMTDSFWGSNWKEVSPDYWYDTSGCDYIRIGTYDVN